MRPDDFAHRVDEVSLTSERVQPLHVDQEMTVGYPERCPQPLLRVVVMPGKLRPDRRIDRLQATPGQSELARAAEQSLAVERYGGGRVIRTREQIRTNPLRRIVPDFCSV